MTTKRTVTPTKVPGIPKPPADVSAGLRRYLESLSEAVEIRLGRRGDQRDRAVTLRELIDGGLAVELANRPFDPNSANQTFESPITEDPTSYTTPTQPTSFTVTGGYELISLFWDRPLYNGHSLTEVWRHTEDIIGDAQLVGVTPSYSYVDSVGEDKSYYYWIRHVNEGGVTGPFNSADGTLGETAVNVELLLTELTGSITEDQLATTLSSRIDLVDGPATLAGSVASQIETVTDAIDQEVTDRIAAVSAVTNAVTQEVTDRIAAVQTATDAIDQEILDRAAAITTVTNAIDQEILDRGNAIDAVNADIAALSNIAAYDGAVSYREGDIVVYENNLYKAIANTLNNLPTNTTYWVDIGAYTSLVDYVEAVSTETTNVRADLYANYYTITDADSAINTAVTGLASETYVTTALADYTNTADLETNYYTKTDTDSAITTATTDMATQTYVATQLADYTNTADLELNYYTKTDTDSAIVVATTGLASQTYVDTQLLDYTTTANLQLNYYTATDTDQAITAATQTLSSEFSAFDPAITWDFENTVDNWSTGSGFITVNAKTVTIYGDNYSVSNEEADFVGDFVSDQYITASDPWFVSPSNLTINGYRNTIVRIRIKRLAGSAWSGRLFYSTSTHSFNEAFYKQVPDITTVGLWRILEWDMSELTSGGSDWTSNTITQIGIDFDTANGDQFEIDWVAIGTKDPFSYSAELEQNYYTIADADSAIAAATLGLASEGYVQTELGNYTNTADLQTNYYTKTDADSAIATATTDMATQTYVTNELGSYTTTADLQTNYYTKTDADSAIATATTDMATQTYVTNELGSYTTTSDLQLNYYTKTDTDSAITTATTDMATQTYVTNELGNYTTTADLQLNYYTKTDTDSAITTATTDMATQTYVTNELGNYTTTADLQLNYYTKTDTDSAITTATTDMATQTYVTTALGDYTNTADLQLNYYTKTDTDSAITTATTDMATQTYVAGQLTNYTTTADLESTYYTATQTDSAISVATTGLASQTYVDTQLLDYTSTADLELNYYTATDTEEAIATSAQDLSAEFSAFDPVATWEFLANNDGWSAQSGTIEALDNTVLLYGDAYSSNSIEPGLVFDFSDEAYISLADPWFVSPVLSINGQRNTIVRARLKHVSGVSWDGRLFYKTASHDFNSAFYKKLDAAPDVGTWRIVEWDMSELTAGGSDWTDNTITQIGIDFDTAAGDVFEVDWIAIGTKNPFSYSAELEQNYYTKADADSAIAVATLGLASEGYVQTELGDYTTTADLQTNYYTKTAADSAIASATTDMATQTYVTNELGSYTNTATLELNYYTKTDADTAISSAVNTLATTVGENTAAISTQATSINGLEAQYTVKVDVAGHVSGYGLASTAVDGTPTSEFGVRADQFWIAPPATSSATAPTTNLYEGYVWLDTSDPENPVTKYYTGSAWSTTPQALPFIVRTTATTVNGETASAGVYIADAYIRNGTITNAKIGDAAIDDAKIANLSATKITADTLDAARIGANTINAEKLAISSNTDGTSSSVYMDSDGAIKVYDSAGTLRVQIGNLAT